MEITTRDPMPANRDPHHVPCLTEIKTRCPKCKSTKRKITNTVGNVSGIKRRCLCRGCGMIYNTMEYATEQK